MRHILTNEGKPLGAVRVWQGPRLLVFSRSARPPVASLDGGDDDGKKEAPDVDASEAKGTKRELRGMSAKSALNLARVLSSLDWGKHGECIHVTLTYWQTWPVTKELLALEKQGLVMQLSRHCECGIWGLEYQSRTKPKEHKVPHWHCLLWLGGRCLEQFELWLRPWWARFSGNSSVHGVHITSGDQARGAWYLAMHAAKRAQRPPFAVGRWWGYIARERLLEAQDLPCRGEAEERERVWAARIYRRCTGGRTRGAGGFSWFLLRTGQTRLLAWVAEHVAHERMQRHKGKNPF